MNGKRDTEERVKEGFCTIILAAGKGKRMKSTLAKVLHPVGGVPMLTHSIAAARAAGSQRIVVVIGHQAERIRALYRADDLLFAEQREQLGTGHAVLQAREFFRDYEGAIIILCGDVPLILPETVRALYDRHRLRESDGDGPDDATAGSRRLRPGGHSRRRQYPEDRRREGCYGGREIDPRDQYRDLLRGERFSLHGGCRPRQPECSEGILFNRYR